MLLADDQKAKKFVLSIGLGRANRLLTMVVARIQRRVDIGNEECPSMFFNVGNVRVAQWEIDLIHSLKRGISITDTYNTPIAAKARIAERIAARKAKRQESFCV